MPLTSPVEMRCRLCGAIWTLFLREIDAGRRRCPDCQRDGQVIIRDRTLGRGARQRAWDEGTLALSWAHWEALPERLHASRAERRDYLARFAAMKRLPNGMRRASRHARLMEEREPLLRPLLYIDLSADEWAKLREGARKLESLPAALRGDQAPPDPDDLLGLVDFAQGPGAAADT